MRPLASQLLRNALVGGGARVITLLVGLVVTPYLWNRLGAERFGVWALAAVVTGFVGFLDLSFRTAFVKFLAEAHATGDREGRDSIVSIALAVYALFSAAVLPGFLLGVEPLVRFLGLPADLHSEAVTVFVIAVVGLVVTLLFSIFPAVCDARQRLDVTNGLGVACLVISTVLVVVAVEAGWGLVGVALAQLAGVTLFSLASVAAAHWMAGPFRLSLTSLGTPWFRRLFRFGIALHVSSACGTVNRQLDKLLLSRWGAGLGFVASYEIGARIASNAGSLQPYLAATLLPASSQLEASGDRPEVLRLYLSWSRYLFFVGIPIFVFLAATAPTVVLAWLGEPDSEAAAVFLLLAAGYLINSLSNAMAFVCQGLGRADVQARQSAFQLAVNVVASVSLLLLLGPLGAPLGTTVALVLGALYFARRFHPLVGTTTGVLVREAVAWPLVASMAGAAAVLGATWPFAPTDRLGALGALALGGVVFTAIYVGICWGAGFVGREELRRLASLLFPKAGEVEG